MWVHQTVQSAEKNLSDPTLDVVHDYLTGHHDEGSGEPVVLEDLTVRADEGEVEPHRRSRSEVLVPEPDVRYLCLT